MKQLIPSLFSNSKLLVIIFKKTFHIVFKKLIHPISDYTKLIYFFSIDVVYLCFSIIYKDKNTISDNDIKEFFKNKGHTDYDKFLPKSLETKKPILLYFTGYDCINCKKMEENIFSEKSIFDKLKNEFIFVSLFVDDKKELPQEDWSTSIINNKIRL